MSIITKYISLTEYLKYVVSKDVDMEILIYSRRNPFSSRRELKYVSHLYAFVCLPLSFLRCPQSAGYS